MSFGEKFLVDHAGVVMTDPRISLVELVANSYDAGALSVKIRWPSQTGERFEIADDGTGMTRAEFKRRWQTLSYDRTREQGSFAEWPPERLGNKKRAAFGQSGKGRHAAFCYSDAYTVETWKGGRGTTVEVQRTHGGKLPYQCRVVSTAKKLGHGTRIWADAVKGLTTVEEIRQAVGAKFLVDPEFQIYLNGEQLRLIDLHDLKTEEVAVVPHGTIKIHTIDGAAHDRTTQLRGITWWVNGRMVAQPSWDGLDEVGAILDGRTAAAKRYSFIVEADFMKPDVKPDWTGFFGSTRWNDTRNAARTFVIQRLDEVLALSRKDRKVRALTENRYALGQLSSVSRRSLGQFVDEIQQKCPRLSEGDLSRTVEVYTKFEQARSGYDLLSRLAACSPDDLDTWNRLMQEWTARDAEVVLGELDRRLRLIEKLQGLVNTATADELHDLQPLFERGLWLFGPEYEAVDFRSNRAMSEVLKRLLKSPESDGSLNRPDFVVLPDASIGVYAAAAWNDGGELSGFRKVLIVELKKGGFKVSQHEMSQALGYADELRGASTLQRATAIVAYVLGAKRDDNVEEMTKGESTKIIPMTYDVLLARGHARTFNLLDRIKRERPVALDGEVEAVIAESQPFLEGFASTAS